MATTTPLNPYSFDEALSALRVVESCLWRIWGQSSASLLMLCLELKVLLTGNKSNHPAGFFLALAGASYRS